MSPSTDPFDDLLTLEDTLYTSAHTQGVADGARAGRIEGRIFGLEKGFEKFAALGELHGRGAVWGSRIPSAPSALPTPSNPSNPSQLSQPTGTATPDTALDPALPSTATEERESGRSEEKLPPLPSPSTRLTSNISLMYHLTDPLTFSTANTEASVADFDDRFKRAGAKGKVIERIIGESATSKGSEGREQGADGTVKRNVRLEGEGGKRGGKKGDDSMEDFGGSRLIR